jgi:pimeloyl-ACP methyl ester carboxylesterase
MNRLMRGAIGAYGTLAPGHAARWFEKVLLTPRPARDRSLPQPQCPANDHGVEYGDRTLALTIFHATPTTDGVPTASPTPTVLLLHGWGGVSADLGAFVDPLVAAGYRVVTCDLPAHGRSDGRRTNIIDAAGAVLAVALPFGRLAAIVTHSFGGPVAALAMTRGLEAERVTMIAPPRSIPALSFPIAAAIGLPRRTADLMFRRFAERMRFEWKEIETDAMVRRLRMPLLVIHDEEDPKVPWSHGAQIAEAAPAGRLLTTSGLGHREILVDPSVVRHVVAFVTSGRRDAARRIA